MAHYKVRYSIGEKGEYTYPEAVARTVWKRLVYHGSDPVFIGETDAVVPDEQHVVLVQADRIATLITEFEMSPPEPPTGGGRNASRASGRARRRQKERKERSPRTRPR